MCSGGGGDVLNLVFGSSYSSYMDCMVRCFSCVTSGLVRLRFEQCCFVDGLFICGCSFSGSNTLQMSITRLSVIIFVCVTVTSCYLLRGVPVVAEEFFVYFHPTACNLFDFSLSFTIILLPLPPSALHQPYRSRLYKGC